MIWLVAMRSPMLSGVVRYVPLMETLTSLNQTLAVLAIIFFSFLSTMRFRSFPDVRISLRIKGKTLFLLFGY